MCTVYISNKVGSFIPVGWSGLSICRLENKRTYLSRTFLDIGQSAVKRTNSNIIFCINLGLMLTSFYEQISSDIKRQLSQSLGLNLIKNLWVKLKIWMIAKMPSSHSFIFVLGMPSSFSIWIKLLRWIKQIMFNQKSLRRKPTNVSQCDFIVDSSN